MKQHRLAFAALTVFATLSGCSDPIPVHSGAGSTAAGSTATSGSGGASTTTGAGGAATTSGTGAGGSDGGTSSSSGSAGGSVPLGPFECNGCICDGLTHFCYTAHGGGGFAPPGPPPPEDLCVDPAPNPYAGCLPVPAGCTSGPTCECIREVFGKWVCKQSGAGLTVDIYPP